MSGHKNTYVSYESALAQRAEQRSERRTREGRADARSAAAGVAQMEMPEGAPGDPAV